MKVISLCFLVALVEGYDLQAAGLAAIRMRPALGLSNQDMAGVFSAGMVGLIAGAGMSGRLADRIGRKPILLIAAFTFGVFSIASGLAGNAHWLIASRFLTGVGLGGAMPSLIAIAGDISPPSRRTFTATLMFCGMPVGGAIVSATANMMMGHLGWRGVFLLGGGAPLLLFPALLAFLPEISRRRAAPPSTISVLFAGNRALVTTLIWVAYLCTLTILYMMLNWLPLLAIGKGLAPMQAPVAALAFNLASVPGSLAAGFAVDRLRLRTAFGAIFIAMVLVMTALVAAVGLTAVVWACAAAGFLIIGAQFALYGVTPRFYPEEGRGVGAGCAVAFGRLGSIIGPLIAGGVLASGGSANAVLLTMIPFAVVSGAALVTIDGIAGRT